MYWRYLVWPERACTGAGGVRPSAEDGARSNLGGVPVTGRRLAVLVVRPSLNRSRITKGTLRSRCPGGRCCWLFFCFRRCTQVERLYRWSFGAINKLRGIGNASIDQSDDSPSFLLLLFPALLLPSRLSCPLLLLFLSLLAPLVLFYFHTFSDPPPK